MGLGNFIYMSISLQVSDTPATGTASGMASDSVRDRGTSAVLTSHSMYYVVLTTCSLLVNTIPTYCGVTTDITDFLLVEVTLTQYRRLVELLPTSLTFF